MLYSSIITYLPTPNFQLFITLSLNCSAFPQNFGATFDTCCLFVATVYVAVSVKV